jgi:lysozyme
MEKNERSVLMKGIDVYSGTVITDWNAIKNDGIEVVYIKLTDGVTYNNPKALEQYNGAKSVGLKVGAYHFAEYNNVNNEYNHFFSEASKYQWDTKPVLDYEIVNSDFNFIAQFMSMNANLLLYGPHSIADKTSLPKNRIWIAEPSDIPDSDYSVPTTVGEYAGIQYAWHGKIHGIQGDSSEDLFSNSILVNSNTVIPVNPQPEQSGDPAVRLIQLQLNTLLKKHLEVDSIKGSLTTAAIKEFQSAMGLKPDGIWGPKTVEAVQEIYSRPTDGVPYPHHEYATRYIQYRVGGAIDGVFFNETKVNVQNWQARHSLNADGIVGPLTWSKMLDENS